MERRCSCLSDATRTQHYPSCEALLSLQAFGQCSPESRTHAFLPFPLFEFATSPMSPTRRIPPIPILRVCVFCYQSSQNPTQSITLKDFNDKNKVQPDSPRPVKSAIHWPSPFTHASSTFTPFGTYNSCASNLGSTVWRRDWVNGIYIQRHYYHRYRPSLCTSTIPFRKHLDSDLVYISIVRCHPSNGFKHVHPGPLHAPRCHSI